MTPATLKLYHSPVSPNSRRVRIFLAEKGLKVPLVSIDLGKGEQRSEAYRVINPRLVVPTLVLDDGTAISETVAICRYFEETQADPPLFGTGAVGKALVDMWIRRIEFQVMQPVGNFWRHAHPRTAALLTQYKDFGEANRATYAGGLKWLDRDLADRPFIAGDSYSMADICALSTVDFATWIGLEIPDELANVKAWHARVSARPSAAA